MAAGRTTLSAKSEASATVATMGAQQGAPWELWIAFFGGLFITWVAAALVSRVVPSLDVSGGAAASMAAGFGNLALLGTPLALSHFGQQVAIPLGMILSIHAPILWFAAMLHRALFQTTGGFSIGAASLSFVQEAGGGILIVGVDRLMTQLAKCCKPAPPDDIVGFVTRGRGISIHRASCASVARLRARQPERIIAADWGKQSPGVFPVDVVVRADDRHGLLRDVSEVLSREKINVTAANTQSRNSIATMHFTLDIADVGQLRRVLAQVREVAGVQSAVRR